MQTIAIAVLVTSVTILSLYAIRHYALMMRRLLFVNPQDSNELTGYVLPSVSVLVPMHNEEHVARDILEALVTADYDARRLQIVAIDDRSDDATGAIIDEFASRYPFVVALHRQSGNGGKPAALEFGTPHATGEILLLFDADYVPGRSTLQQLVAPFCDPQVGAVMGRVVPHNANASVLAALLELERAAGYQIGQQARQQMRLTPQFGGTVGGVRASALKAVGGWDVQSLTEDTELTFRLVLRGWKIAYVNRVECYEEVPESWRVRRRQVSRWARGHTDCFHRFAWQMLRSRELGVRERVDGLFVLACYLTAPVLVAGWLASLWLVLLHPGALSASGAVLMTFTGFQLFGNQATFFELGAAAYLDRNAHRVLLMPLSLVTFFASTVEICRALARRYLDALSPGGPPRWHKTTRFRRNGHERLTAAEIAADREAALPRQAGLSSQVPLTRDGHGRYVPVPEVS